MPRVRRLRSSGSRRRSTRCAPRRSNASRRRARRAHRARSVVDRAARPQRAIDLALAADGRRRDGHRRRVGAAASIDIPFFGWSFRPLVAIVAAPDAGRYAIARLRSDARGRTAADAAEGGRRAARPARSRPEQSTHLATRGRGGAIVAFAAALFGQLGGPISDSFRASDATIGIAFALTRLGALFALRRDRARRPAAAGAGRS